MKKFLFTTTSLLVFSLPSYAAGLSYSPTSFLSLSLGGRLTGWAGFVQQDRNGIDYREVDLDGDGNLEGFKLFSSPYRGDGFLDGKLYLTASSPLSASLKAGAQFDFTKALHLEDPYKTYDKHFVFLRGDHFGKLEAGRLRNVGQHLHLTAPDVSGLGLDESRAFHLITPMETVDNGTIPHNNTAVYALRYQPTILYSTAPHTDSYTSKVSYTTPRFFDDRLTLALSYIPEYKSHPTYKAGKIKTGMDDSYVGALLYRQNLGLAFFAFSYSYARFALEGRKFFYPHSFVDLDRTEQSSGFNFSYAGFTVGGAYRSIDGRRGDPESGDVSSFGVSYEFGPFATSLSYLLSEASGLYNSPLLSIDKGKTAGLFYFGDNKDTTDLYLLSGRYTLAQGLHAWVSLGSFHVESQLLDWDYVASQGTSSMGVAPPQSELDHDGAFLAAGFTFKF